MDLCDSTTSCNAINRCATACSSRVALCAGYDYERTGSCGHDASDFPAARRHLPATNAASPRADPTRPNPAAPDQPGALLANNPCCPRDASTVAVRRGTLRRNPARSRRRSGTRTGSHSCREACTAGARALPRTRPVRPVLAPDEPGGARPPCHAPVHARPQRVPRGRTTGGRHRELDFVRALASGACPSRRPPSLSAPSLSLMASCFSSCRGAGGRRGGGRWPASRPSTDGTSAVPAALRVTFRRDRIFFSLLEWMEMEGWVAPSGRGAPKVRKLPDETPPPPPLSLFCSVLSSTLLLLVVLRLRHSGEHATRPAAPRPAPQSFACPPQPLPRRRLAGGFAWLSRPHNASQGAR
ncbi:hypothetical protein PVAP13_4KG364800 [Panicum virgatum]|uniref:Uncharacterized protein n=1 Tax=Panicum virgatum TaxID=38727 RepID=A0A8T0TRI5_PANVG|nr:hypothetical protein PVAP13_4KG364800 [Panicum virgatum]